MGMFTLRGPGLEYLGFGSHDREILVELCSDSCGGRCTWLMSVLGTLPLKINSFLDQILLSPFTQGKTRVWKMELRWDRISTREEADPMVL